MPTRFDLSQMSHGGLERWREVAATKMPAPFASLSDVAWERYRNYTAWLEEKLRDAILAELCEHGRILRGTILFRTPSISKLRGDDVYLFPDFQRRRA